MPFKYITGLFVHPDNFEMATGLYRNDNGKTFALDVASPELIAQGSIDHGEYSDDYSLSARLTGFPRVHALPGVTDKYQRKGWGTALYCCASAAAYLNANDWLAFARGTEGDGPGVSSMSGAPGGRSDEADKWWVRAKAAGLVESEEKCSDDEEEEEDFSFSERRTSSEFDEAVLEEVKRLVDDDFSEVSSFRVEGTGQKTVAGECRSIDKLLFSTIWAKGLVVATADENLRLSINDTAPLLYQWQSEDMEDHLDDVAPDVLRLVNTGYLAMKPHGRDALEQLLYMARKAGLSQQDISSMIDRYNAKVDAGGVRYEQAAVAVENPGRRRIRRVRVGGKVILMRENPRRVIVPRKIARGKVVFYGPRPNPAALPKGTMKNLQKLYERRISMGYGALAGLP